MQKLLVAKNNSLLTAEAACCKNSLVTRCKIRPLLVAEITRWKTSLVTRCKIRPLLVPEIARCKKSLITRCKICLILVEEVARCKKSLVTCCRICLLQKIYLLLVVKLTRYLLQNFLFAKNKVYLILVEKVVIWKKITRYSLQKLLFMKSHSFLVLKFAWYSLQKLLITKVTCYILQNSLVTRCRSCSLRKIIRYSLQTLLAACFRGGVTFYNFAKKWLQHRKIFCEFLRKFKNTYSVEHLQTTVSENDIKASINFYSFHLTSINLFTLIWLSLIELLLNCLIKLN